MSTQGSRRSAVLLVGTTLGLALLAAAVRPRWVVEHRGLSRLLSPSPPALPTTAPSAAQPSPYLPPPQRDTLDLSWLPWVLLALVLAPIVVLIVRKLLAALRDVAEQRAERAEVAEIEVWPELPVLRRGAAAAEAWLVEAGSAPDAIVAAWLELEEAATGSGVLRDPAETPTEFTAAVLARTGVDAAPVQGLLRLYLRARFSAPGPEPAGGADGRPSIDEADVTEARRCIRALADAWARMEVGMPAAPTSPTGSTGSTGSTAIGAERR